MIMEMKKYVLCKIYIFVYLFEGDWCQERYRVGKAQPNQLVKHWSSMMALKRKCPKTNIIIIIALHIKAWLQNNSQINFQEKENCEP